MEATHGHGVNGNFQDFQAPSGQALRPADEITLKGLGGLNRVGQLHNMLEAKKVTGFRQLGYRALGVALMIIGAATSAFSVGVSLTGGGLLVGGFGTMAGIGIAAHGKGYLDKGNNKEVKRAQKALDNDFLSYAANRGVVALNSGNILSELESYNKSKKNASNAPLPIPMAPVDFDQIMATHFANAEVEHSVVKNVPPTKVVLSDN